MRRKTRTKKQKRQRTKLCLPDLEHVKSAVLVSLRSPESQRSYRRSIDDFVYWYCSEPRLSFNKTVVTVPVPKLPVSTNRDLAPATGADRLLHDDFPTSIRLDTRTPEEFYFATRIYF
jgi:hypothetical protein